MKNTKIEWADHTFNPWWGCTKVSPACDNCYAAALDKRTGGDHWGAGQLRRRTNDANWRQPLKWNRNHEAFFKEHGHRQRVFCASMADVFDNAVDHKWRIDLMHLIADTPKLDWLLLTKRIGNVQKDVRFPPNVWLGKKYGILSEDLRRGFSECFRVLKPHGSLIFKWNETQIKTKDILALTDQKPLLGHPSGARAKTHWVLFVKDVA